MNEAERQAIIRSARERRGRLEGVEPPVLNADEVPVCLRDLLREAEALGAAEDPVRFRLVRDLSYEYIADLGDRISAVEDEYHAWHSAATRGVAA